MCSAHPQQLNSLGATTKAVSRATSEQLQAMQVQCKHPLVPSLTVVPGASELMLLTKSDWPCMLYQSPQEGNQVQDSEQACFLKQVCRRLQGTSANGQVPCRCLCLSEVVHNHVHGMLSIQLGVLSHEPDAAHGRKHALCTALEPSGRCLGERH